jgi:hypothetical protein
MVFALVIAITTVILVARTRLWWLPGVVVAACALPVLGYYLGSPQEYYWKALGAATTGVLLTSAVIGFASILSLVSYAMHRALVKPTAE